MKIVKDHWEIFQSAHQFICKYRDYRLVHGQQNMIRSCKHVLSSRIMITKPLQHKGQGCTLLFDETSLYLI